MKIGGSPPPTYRPETMKPGVPRDPRGSGSFDAHLADARATLAKTDVSSAGDPRRPDFTDMTKAEYVAWGKSQFAQGHITLDDLFQVQFAGGDFDGSVSSDTGHHDFVAFFEGLIENEIEAHRASDPQSMIPAYRHVLTSMSKHG